MATRGLVGAKAALIWLHGSGDSGEGVEEWLRHTSGGAFQRRMQEKDIAIVYPSAPAIKYTLNGGFPQTVWFDRVTMDYGAPEDKAGMARSVAQIDGEIDKLVAAGIPLNRIGVGGMSMGGCLALHVVYGSGKHAGALAMAASFSTFLAEDSALDAEAAARFKADSGDSEKPPPLLMSHGDSDRMVYPAWAKASRDRLEVSGVPAPAEVKMWPGMGHDMCREELDELATFVINNLGE